MAILEDVLCGADELYWILQIDANVVRKNNLFSAASSSIKTEVLVVLRNYNLNNSSNEGFFTHISSQLSFNKLR